MGSNKLKSSSTAKKIVKKMKDSLQNDRKYLQRKQLTRDYFTKYTNGSCSSISKKIKIKKWIEDLNSHFSEEDI